jgi:hypothetical protein
LQGNELTDISYLAQGVLCARSVCRVVIRSNRGLLGYATGLLIAPGVSRDACGGDQESAGR